MGAGDSAVAGWFSAYTRGHTIEATIRHAAGALNATVPDGMSWNKGWEALHA